MHELRKDYLLEDWVIIAGGREKRPQLTKETGTVRENKDCPFCPGNEERTPPEITRAPILADRWRVRVVPNKFSAVDETGVIEKLDLPLRRLKTAYGRHEVIIETPVHSMKLADFTLGRVMEIIGVYIERVIALESMEEIKEVALFKNEGVKAGASILHSHTQLIAFNQLSQKTRMELNAYDRYLEKNQACPYCEIVRIESDTQRKVWENESFLCIAPFASRVPYQLMILPKKHSRHFMEMYEKEKRDFAEILKKALTAIKALGADYNMYFKNAPHSIRDFHWTVNILPRTTIQAGFEEATGCIINSHSPEFCASFYREEFAKEV